jgi:hypothetical protein
MPLFIMSSVLYTLRLSYSVQVIQQDLKVIPTKLDLAMAVNCCKIWMQYAKWASRKEKC